MDEDFFDEVDSTGVVEQHIQAVLGLEDSQAREILKQYAAIRKDLVDRLSRARAGTFTAQHLRGVLAQVDGAVRAMTEHLSGAMIDGAKQAALKGVDHSLQELRVFDEKFTGAVTPINLNAALLAHDTANLLVTKYRTNLDAYGSDLLRQITNGLFNASLGSMNYAEVVGAVSQFFTADEWKLHRIIRTELHGLYNRGKLTGLTALDESGQVEDLLKTLIHPLDARTGEDSKYAAELRLVAALDEPFEYEWNKKLRSYMHPPDRPNDRSVMVPYRQDWGATRSPAWFLPTGRNRY